MKSPKQNRFEGHGAKAEPAPSEGAAFLLDVEGHVTFEGEVPRTVTVAGVTHAFDAEGHVTFGGRVYQLVKPSGRACLAIVGATTA